VDGLHFKAVPSEQVTAASIFIKEDLRQRMRQAARVVRHSSEANLGFVFIYF